MIYVGGRLSSNRTGFEENCLIDPKLPVSRRDVDPAGDTMSYWPSYSSISPSARRSYLEWLADHRQDPDIGIGHVFLFFYGLERRLFVDRSAEEAAAIIAEVRRLLGIYGGNGSFNSYARRLLDAGELLIGTPNAAPEPAPDLRDGYEIPISIKVHLGTRLAAGHPLSSEDALLWVLSLPDTSLRTPATRCFEELRALWHIRFRERFPDGLRVRVPKRRISMHYRAASGTFDVAIPVAGGDLPDISAVTAPLDGLRDLLSGCTDELDSYSRLLGRRPEARGTPQAVLLLPNALFGAVDLQGLRETRQQVEHLFAGGSIAAARAEQLFEMLGLDVPANGKLSAAAMTQMGELFDRLDIGYEPDRRYGPVAIGPDNGVVLFKAPRGGPVDPDRTEYVSARINVDVTALAAASDGEVTRAEIELLNGDLRAAPGLSPQERTRLLAYAATLLKDTPKQKAIMSRLAKLPEDKRNRVAQSAIGAALADGHVSPEEVKFLEKLLKTLGFPKDDVYSAIHRGAVRVDEPVTVSPEKWVPGVPIPPKPAGPVSGIAIDEARLERIRRETDAVSALLTEIFVDEEAIEAVRTDPVPPAVAGEGPAYPGLDAAHTRLLTLVLSAGELDESVFERYARDLRLLPDGARETINEWGFEQFDEPVLEGDNSIVIVEHIRSELEVMGVNR